MRPWMDRARLRGRIHGRLMLVLVAVAVFASAVAIWQFSVLRDDHSPDFAEFDDGTNATAIDLSGAEDSTAAAPPETPSPTVSASPTDDTASSSEADASEPAGTTEAAVAGPQCTASLALDSEWDGSVSVSVTIAGTGTESVDGWEVEIAIKHLTVTTTWGLAHIEGDRYGDILLNASIEPGGSVHASFQANVQGRYEIPPTIPCTPV